MLREGYFARPSLMTKDVAAIKEFYGEKGYNRASIEVRKTLLEKDHMVVVTYQIVEGEKIKIKHIDFIGNGAIESKFLIKLMESKEDRWWRGGELKPNVLEEDLKTIKQLYENEGYLDANVAIDRQVEVDGGKHVDLYIRIDEGRRYYIGDVTWTGNTVFPDDEIEGLVVIEEGNPMRSRRWRSHRLPGSTACTGKRDTSGTVSFLNGQSRGSV